MTQQLTQQQQNMADRIAANELRRQNRKRETAIGSSPAAPQVTRDVRLQDEQVARREKHTPFLEEVEDYIASVRKRMAKNPIPSDLDKIKPEVNLNTARRLLKKDLLDMTATQKFKDAITDLKWFMGRANAFSDVTRPMTAGQRRFLNKLGVKSDTDLTIAEANKQIKSLMVEQFGDEVQQSVSKLRRAVEAKDARVAAAEIGKLEQKISTWIELDEFPTYYFDPRTFRVMNHYGKAIKMEIDKNSSPRWRLRASDGKRKWLTVADAFKMAGGDLIDE